MCHLQYFKYLTCINSFNLHHSKDKCYCHPHFTSAGVEAQRGEEHLKVIKAVRGRVKSDPEIRASSF